MERFIAFIDQIDGENFVTLLYPFEKSGERILNLYENDMQEAQVRQLPLDALINHIVVFNAQKMALPDFYGVKVLEQIPAGKYFPIEMSRQYTQRVPLSEELELGNLEEEALENIAATPSQLPAKFDDLINLPGSSADYIRGIDISHHNIIVDWNAIRQAGVEFVYIKISEGVGTPDQEAQTHALTAKQKGFKIGYYHFGRPDTKHGGTVKADAKAEAQEVINLLKNLPKADLPLMLDLENTSSWDTPLSPTNYLEWVETFMSYFYDPLALHLIPLIYSRKEYLDRKLPFDHTLNTRYKLWLSRYTRDYKVAAPARVWPDWSIWQFTEAGRLGSNPNLDLNIKRASG